MFYPHTIKGKANFKVYDPSFSNPSDILGLEFWIKGDSGMLDLSNNAYTPISDSSTILPAELNGHDVFNWDGISQFTRFQNILNAQDTLTISMVYRPNANEIETFFEQSGTSELSLEGSSIDPGLFINNSGNSKLPSTLTVNEWYVLTWRADGVNIIARLGGISGTPVAFVGDTGGDDLYLASRLGSQRWSNISISEMVIYNNAISTGDLNNLELYLQNEYGL